MGLGGNPYGPAGTGKTESVKALGGMFGRQVLVFNCDEVSPYVPDTSMITYNINANSVIAVQTMVWAIFHLLPINLKFQLAILSKYNIAISVVNGPFFC